MRCHFNSSWNDSPFVVGPAVFVCWPESHAWNSLSFWQTCLSASVTTYDGEQSRNSAYFVSLSLASSSSRKLYDCGFGLLGWCFQDCHFDLLLSVIGPASTLDLGSNTFLYARGQNTVTVPRWRAGATPQNFGRL